MTINTTPAKSWSQHNNRQDDPRYNTCSPNLIAIRAEMEALWGVGFLGCHGERNVRGGELPSAHSHGAAIDLRYLEQIGRARFLIETVPWLIANSEELHISAIHDYVGGRIWHAMRTNKVSDAYTAWWRPQAANPNTGMGQSWAGWVHLETTEPGWGDSSAIIARLTTFPPTTPPLPPQEDDMKIAIIQPEGSNAVFLAETTLSGVALNVRWSGPGTPKVEAVIAAHLAVGAVDRRTKDRPSIAELGNCFLLGSLPVDDVRQWTVDDFAG